MRGAKEAKGAGGPDGPREPPEGGGPRAAHLAWRVAGLALLALLYVTLMPRFKTGDLLLGATAAALALRAARPLPLRTGSPRPRDGGALVALPGLAASVAADVAAGSWRVTLVSLGLRPSAGRIVTVPLAGRSAGGIAVTGFLATLSPGTVLLDVDVERDVLIFHVLAEDAEAFRERLQRFYRERQRLLFP